MKNNKDEHVYDRLFSFFQQNRKNWYIIEEIAKLTDLQKSDVESCIELLVKEKKVKKVPVPGSSPVFKWIGDWKGEVW